ncbi:hypothetical protein CR513_08419, partial [Mucuna pruriens]
MKGEPRIELKETVEIFGLGSTINPLQKHNKSLDFLIITTEALMLYFMDKSNAENKVLEEHGEIHMFVFDQGGVKAILSCSGLVGLDILLQTTRT